MYKAAAVKLKSIRLKEAKPLAGIRRTLIFGKIDEQKS